VIKAAGGITFAQQPESVRFDGMPRSAIAGGCVDLVLPPEQISTEPACIGRHPFLPFTGTTAPEGEPAFPQGGGLGAPIQAVAPRVRGGFHLYKKSTIKRRVARRMALQKLESVRDYLRFVDRDRKELDALFQKILIHVTGFCSGTDRLPRSRERSAAKGRFGMVLAPDGRSRSVSSTLYHSRPSFRDAVADERHTKSQTPIRESSRSNHRNDADSSRRWESDFRSVLYPSSGQVIRGAVCLPA